MFKFVIYVNEVCPFISIAVLALIITKRDYDRKEIDSFDFVQQMRIRTKC